jgi:hypothetical protein
MSTVKALLDSPTIFQTEPLQEAKVLKIENAGRSDVFETGSQSPKLENNSTACATTVVVPL